MTPRGTGPGGWGLASIITGSALVPGGPVDSTGPASQHVTPEPTPMDLAGREAVTMCAQARLLLTHTDTAVCTSAAHPHCKLQAPSSRLQAPSSRPNAAAQVTMSLARSPVAWPALDSQSTSLAGLGLRSCRWRGRDHPLADVASGRPFVPGAGEVTLHRAATVRAREATVERVHVQASRR